MHKVIAMIVDLDDDVRKFTSEEMTLEDATSLSVALTLQYGWSCELIEV